jgi:two-component system sensor histidine kinase BaeS
MVDQRRFLGPIGNRLALATVVVAVGAVAVLGVLTLVAAKGDVSRLALQEQERAASATASAVMDAYRAAGTWTDAHLSGAAMLAADSQASLVVLDNSGRTVKLPPISGSSPPRLLQGALFSHPIVIHGQKVGTAIVHFYEANLPSPATRLRDALVRTVALGTTLGVLLALAVALALSRWITRPVVALTGAVRAMGRGERSVRVGDARGSGELAELASAFDTMADTIAREEELRRTVVTDVAHELRTPLAILQANSESLADGIIDPTRRNLSSLHDEVLRLGRIVEDLETIASAEAAVLKLNVVPTDLADVARETIEALRPSYQLADVKLLAELTTTPGRVDRGRAGQILRNLLTNALKFTGPGGSVRVKVATENDAAVLVVSDTGTGIEPDELPYVFERFWRGREAGRVAGSGVGLAVVHTLLEAHGGTIDVTSEPAEGTRFTVRFPRAAWPPAPSGDRRRPGSSQPHPDLLERVPETTV